MIYLIKELIPVDPNDLYGKNAIPVLKIGYTDDKNMNKRMSAYHYDCIGFKLIHCIPCGTELHEKALHLYFRKYKYPKLKEWFYMNKIIVDEFLKFTLDDLDKIDRKSTRL